jgi:replicative DNA helicase
MKKSFNKNSPQIITKLADYGKVPPASIEAEESVLGTCLIYPDSISEIKLKPEMFYKDANQKIFASILELANKGTCDIVTVTDDLKKKAQLNSVGGPVYITMLTSKVFSDQMLQIHALMVKQTYIAREYIRIGQELINRGFTDDIAEIAEFAETSLFNLSDFTQSKECIFLLNPDTNS